MINKLIALFLSSVLGVLVLLVILYLYNNTEFDSSIVAMAFFYSAPLMLLLIFSTIVVIEIIKRFKRLQDFLITETGFFFISLISVILLFQINKMITNDYELKMFFLISYLIAMLIYFQLKKVFER